MRLGFLLLSSLSIVFASIESPAQQNPLVGTWKIDIASSRFDSNNAPPSDSANVFKAFGNGGVSNVRSGSTEAAYSLNFDGQDYPYKGVAGRDAVSGRALNPKLFRLVFKNKGEPVQINYLTVSADGKTMTIFSMITPDEKYVDQRKIVYHRQ